VCKITKDEVYKGRIILPVNRNPWKGLGVLNSWVGKNWGF